MKKVAVVLFNLGGPDSLAAVRPFLFNLFNDPAIIRLPSPLRQFVAWMISTRRDKVAQEIYTQLDGRSPILPNTEAQATALEQSLRMAMPQHSTKVFVAMRYWHPFVKDTMRAVKEFAPDEIVLLPLYPQFSTTTTASSLLSWQQEARQQKLNIPTKSLCCYPEEAGFIEALIAPILAAYTAAKQHGTPRILFSAHGLPEKIVKAGDPYQWQCEQTVSALVRRLNLPGLDYVLAYQSRVGPLKWIGPATDAEVERAGSTHTPLVVVPIAFVSEHSETLVEIDREYRHLATERGVPHYAYVPTVSTNPAFINGLAGLVRQALQSEKATAPHNPAFSCPKEFCGCALFRQA